MSLWPRVPLLFGMRSYFSLCYTLGRLMACPWVSSGADGAVHHWGSSRCAGGNFPEKNQARAQMLPKQDVLLYSGVVSRHWGSTMGHLIERVCDSSKPSAQNSVKTEIIIPWLVWKFVPSVGLLAWWFHSIGIYCFPIVPKSVQKGAMPWGVLVKLSAIWLQCEKKKGVKAAPENNGKVWIR